jgi:hypothetical protein
MINNIIRFFVKKFPEETASIFCEDFLTNIPKEVSDPSITLLVTQKEQIEKWLRYEAYLIIRRATITPKHADYYTGVLTAIKTILALISVKAKGRNVIKDFGETINIKEYAEQEAKRKKALEGIDNFKKGVVKK